MKQRILGAAGALAAVTAAIILYSSGAARSSNHQDTPTLVNRAAANITDMYIFPDPSNASNVAMVMDLNTTLSPSAAPALDPSVLYQFKISHGTTPGTEDTVIQLLANSAGTGQTITLYGPGKPNVTGANSTLIGQSGSFGFGQNATVSVNGQAIQAFVGSRADPFFFDLLQFFTFLPDRNFKTAGQGLPVVVKPPPGPAGYPNNGPSFNGFSAGTTSGVLGNYACNTGAAGNAISGPSAIQAPGSNVTSIVLSIPKTLLAASGQSSVLHVWGTTSTVSGS